MLNSWPHCTYQFLQFFHHVLLDPTCECYEGFLTYHEPSLSSPSSFFSKNRPLQIRVYCESQKLTEICHVFNFLTSIKSPGKTDFSKKWNRQFIIEVFSRGAQRSELYFSECSIWEILRSITLFEIGKYLRRWKIGRFAVLNSFGCMMLFGKSNFLNVPHGAFRVY